MDAYFDETWGGYPVWQLVTKAKTNGKHRIRITLLKEKNEKSVGHHFEIHAMLLAGIDRKCNGSTPIF